jgi:hypothetical protein
MAAFAKTTPQSNHPPASPASSALHFIPQLVYGIPKYFPNITSHSWPNFAEEVALGHENLAQYTVNLTLTE